jgi:hypothetical protein
MGLMPERIKYLAAAGTMLGHINAGKIQQVGEKIAAVRCTFAVVKEFSGLSEAA